MGSRPERGAYGNARGKPAKQKQRREARLADPRVASALAEARSHQAEIDRMVDAGEPIGRPTLVYIKAETRPEGGFELSQPTDTKPDGPAYLDMSWTIRDVYFMLNQGYRTKYVAKRTGYDHSIVFDLWCQMINEEVDNGKAQSEGGEGGHDLPQL